MYTTLAFLALLGAPYIYEISSLRVNIIKWQVKFNPVAKGLTYYQIASCVRLQCWAEKRSIPSIPRLRALDNLVVGQQFLFNLLPLMEDVISVTIPPPFRTDLVLHHFNGMYCLKCYSVPFILSRPLQLCRI